MLVGGSPRVVRGRLLPAREMRALFDTLPAAHSATVKGYADLFRLARELVRRGSVRPSVYEARGMMQLGWRAIPDASERAVLAAIVQRMPPAGIASRPEQCFRCGRSRACS